MQLRFLTLLIGLISCISISAQTGFISGTVVDKTNQPLPNATILLRSLNNSFSEATDIDGKFNIEVPANVSYSVEFSFINSTPIYRTANLKQGQSTNWKIKLFEISTKLGIATVVDKQRPSMTKMDPKLIVKIPSINNDISSIILTQGLGTSITSELSSGYNVRGGNFDENLVYVNDIEVYRPFLVRAGQQEGLSFPNPDMISTMSFSAGGFEARYGDKLSSVLDISYNRPSEFSGSLMASLLGGALHFEDKSKKGNFTYNTGFRYKSNAYVLGSLDTEGDYNPNYIDLQTYMTWRPNDKGVWNFDILGNYSRNRYNFVPQTRETNIGNINEALRLTIFFDGQERSQFETGFGAISANYVPFPKRLLKFQLSAFKTQESETFDILGQYFLDELERDLGADEFGDVLRNLGVGSFLEHGRNYLDATVLTFNHKGLAENDDGDRRIRWGVRIQNEVINDELREWIYLDSVGFSTPVAPSNQIFLNEVIIGKNEVNSIRGMSHLQYEKELETEKGNTWTANVGVRANYWNYNNETVVSPRAVFSYRPLTFKEYTDSTGNVTKKRKDILYKFSAGYYYQPPFYRELRRFDGTLNSNIQAQKSIHFLTGIDYNFTSWGRPFKFIGEAYYKNLARIIPYEIDNVRIRYYADDTAKGYTAGTDFMVNGEFIKGVQSWIRLSLLHSREDIADDNFLENYNSDGELIIEGITANDEIAETLEVDPGYIRRPTDQLFSFSMFFQDEMPRYPAWKVQVTGFYGTNLPYGPPGNERRDDILKTPSYRRVDLGLSRELFYNRSLRIQAIEEGTLEAKPGEMDKKNLFSSGFISLEFFNLLGINNTINHTWIEAVNGRQYAIPNFLTGRRINLKLVLKI